MSFYIVMSLSCCLACLYERKLACKYEYLWVILVNILWVNRGRIEVSIRASTIMNGLTYAIVFPVATIFWLPCLSNLNALPVEGYRKTVLINRY